MPNKRTLLFFAVVVISFVVMTYQSKKGQMVSDSFINRLLNGSHKTATFLTDTVKGPFERMALRAEENAQLKKKVNELLLDRERYQEATIENTRLTELLKLKENQRNFVAAARIIARGVDHWTKTLVIDKGLKDGVVKDMAAVTPRGLAGKIMNSSASYSGLLLITDINFSAAVRLQESRREGVLTGTGAKTCILKYIPYEDEIKQGDIVITSGLDSLFPPGIPVGYISKVDNKGRGGNFQYIEVVPYQDDTKMEEVIVVR
jgi:rod shape-determining protein MreC